MKYINIRSFNLRQCFAGVLFFLFVSTASHAQFKAKPGEKVTTVGERQEMQCGEYKVVLTCRHSEEIATRQRKHPRLCNDNTLAFIGKDGTLKVFGTYREGKEWDKTPVEVECQQFLPINKYQVRVLLHDTAASSVVRLSSNAEPIKEADRLRYRIDYTESKSLSFIAIKEASSWQ